MSERICHRLQAGFKNGVQKVAFEPEVRIYGVRFPVLSALQDETICVVGLLYEAASAVNKGGTAIYSPFAVWQGAFFIIIKLKTEESV